MCGKMAEKWDSAHFHFVKKGAVPHFSCGNYEHVPGLSQFSVLHINLP